MSGDLDNRILRAALYILTAMLVLGFVDNFFSLAMKEAGLWQFHAMRTLMMLPVLLLISKLSGARLWPRRFGRVLLRSSMLAIGMLIYFAGLGVLPISQVAAGLFTSPIWILIFSVLFYGERIGIFRIGAMVAGFMGVLLVLRPDPHDLSWLTLMPLASGAFYGGSMLLTRKLCDTEDALCLTAASFVVLGICGGIALIWFTFFPIVQVPTDLAFLVQGWARPSVVFWGILLLQVVGSIGAVNLLNRAYLNAHASYIAVFEYSFLGFATGWAWLLWGTALDAFTALGVAVIVASGIVIALRSRQAEPSSNQSRSEGLPGIKS